MNKECNNCINFPTFENACPFIFKCKHDFYECDEKCSEHIKRGRIQELRTRIEQLDDSRKLLDALFQGYKDELESIK